MGLLNIFKKEDGKKKIEKQEEKKVTPKGGDQDKKSDKKEPEYKTLQPKDQIGAVSSEPGKESKEKVKKTSKEDSKDAYKVLIRPLITEKATDLVNLNKYCFEVSPRANKIEIKKAIKALYNVKPLDVNLLISRGKRVTQGRVSGKRKNWKKAIVTLKQGDKIEIYEGV